MDIETRIKNLEHLVNRLMDLMIANKFYIDSDITSCKKTNTIQNTDILQNIANIDYLAMMSDIDIPTEG